MKRLGTALAIALWLATSSSASAYTLTPDSLHDTATIQAGRAAAAYWHAEPPCPDGLRVATYDGTYPPTAGAVAGEPGSAVAASGDCTIWLNRAWWWPPFDGTDSTGLTWAVEYCRTIVHEWGHLVLGYSYFADVNPSDPAHSPDPQSIMYASPTVVPAQCEAHRRAKRRAAQRSRPSPRHPHRRPHPHRQRQRSRR